MTAYINCAQQWLPPRNTETASPFAAVIVLLSFAVLVLVVLVSFVAFVVLVAPLYLLLLLFVLLVLFFMQL